ncbi:MAG TPA: phytanoyl-CoA dioxygenase family protein [Geminicoccaceae bacterium]|nr:phytanoyl-CoA dioxygenase family protein [Geminicoccaceae bacterium]
MSADVRVFFEPKIPLHDPELYAFERQEEGVPAAEAGLERTLQRYRDDGFLMLRGLIPKDEVLAARAELEAMARADPPGCAMIWYEGALRDQLALAAARDREMAARGSGGGGFVNGQEGKGLPALDPELRARHVRKFAGFVDRQPALGRLSRQPALMALVERLVGGAPALFQDMALVKPARGREKPWHQDHAFFNVALDTPIVGVWIPMGAVTPENGCMHLLAGGHKAGPRAHFKRRDWQICDTDVPAAGRVAVPMTVGDVLLFDGKIPHGTPINRTDDFRWAVQYHYRPADTVLVDDAVRLGAFGSEGKNVTC